MSAHPPVLFMDIDGVLNSRRTAVAFGSYPHRLDQLGKFDPVAIGLVRRLCDDGVVIVLSSAWRTMYPHVEVGTALGLPIIDKTPMLCGSRGAEIADWLTRHPEVTTWAIVDDNGDMLAEQMPRFVQTSEDNGIVWRDYARLRELLGLSGVYQRGREREWMAPGRTLMWEDS